MMTLEDAIKHCKDVALSCNDNEKQCALEHVQLMQWLKELRALRKLVKPEYLQEIRGLQKTWGKEEVDFDKEFEEFVVNDPVIGSLVNFNAAMVIAKHFYELGLKANDEESRKFLGFIAVKLMVDKEEGIRYLVTSLCANIQVMSEIVESLCGKTPQEFIEQDLEIKFEDMNLDEIK